MKHLLLRFFLILCVLLSGTYGQSYAHVYQPQQEAAVIAPQDSLPYAVPGYIQNNLSGGRVIYTAPFSGKKHHDRIESSDREDEEDRWISLKKTADDSSYFTSFYTTVAIPAQAQGMEKRLLSHSKHFLYAPAYRWHILFRVFRI